MDRLLTINGKTYKAAEFDINFMCDMENMGISLEDIDSKTFNIIRIYVALSMGTDVKTAGKELTEHLKNEGSLDEISNVMSDVMKDSGFFRQEQKSEKTGDTTRTRKTKKTGSEEVIS